MKYISTILIAVIFITSISANTRRSHAQQTSSLTARQIAQRTFPSVVVLVAENVNGRTAALGSGFFVQSNVIATNYHVIENASRIYTKIIGKEDVYEVSGTVGIDKEHDLALLKVPGLSVRPLSFGNINDVEVGDIVYAIGNPEGQEGTFSNGIVSALRGRDYIQITAPISHGSSGGPILNQSGEVIGVATWGYKEGQNLNFAISGFYLISLLSNMSSFVNPLPRPSSVASVESNENVNTERKKEPPVSRPPFQGFPARPICPAPDFPQEAIWDADNFKKLMEWGEIYLEAVS